LAIWQALGDKRGSAWSLEALAYLYFAQAQQERAVRLCGAVEGLREAIHSPLEPCFRAEYDRNLVAAREALGTEAFAAVWAEGRAMTLEQAVAYALEEEHA